jgi:hypothetical protein
MMASTTDAVPMISSLPTALIRVENRMCLRPLKIYRTSGRTTLLKRTPFRTLPNRRLVGYLRAQPMSTKTLHHVRPQARRSHRALADLINHTRNPEATSLIRTHPNGDCTHRPTVLSPITKIEASIHQVTFRRQLNRTHNCIEVAAAAATLSKR